MKRILKLVLIPLLIGTASVALPGTMASPTVAPKAEAASGCTFGFHYEAGELTHVQSACSFMSSRRTPAPGWHEEIRTVVQCAQPIGGQTFFRSNWVRYMNQATGFVGCNVASSTNTIVGYGVESRIVNVY